MRCDLSPIPMHMMSMGACFRTSAYRLHSEAGSTVVGSIYSTCPNGTGQKYAAAERTRSSAEHFSQGQNTHPYGGRSPTPRDFVKPDKCREEFHLGRSRGKYHACFRLVLQNFE
jgi:hypothetical protein